MKKHWEFNSSIHPDGDKLIRKDFFNIGFAADTGRGLVVPVVNETDRKSIVQLADDIFIQELHSQKLYDETSQAFAVFLPVKSVGVMGDGRRYSSAKINHAYRQTGDYYVTLTASNSARRPAA